MQQKNSRQPSPSSSGTKSTFQKDIIKDTNSSTSAHTVEATPHSNTELHSNSKTARRPTSAFQSPQNARKPRQTPNPLRTQTRQSSQTKTSPNPKSPPDPPPSSSATSTPEPRGEGKETRMKSIPISSSSPASSRTHSEICIGSLSSLKSILREESTPHSKYPPPPPPSTHSSASSSKQNNAPTKETPTNPVFEMDLLPRRPSRLPPGLHTSQSPPSPSKASAPSSVDPDTTPATPLGVTPGVLPRTTTSSRPSASQKIPSADTPPNQSIPGKSPAGASPRVLSSPSSPSTGLVTFPLPHSPSPHSSKSSYTPPMYSIPNKSQPASNPGASSSPSSPSKGLTAYPLPPTPSPQSSKSSYTPPVYSIPSTSPPPSNPRASSSSTAPSKAVPTSPLPPTPSPQPSTSSPKTSNPVASREEDSSSVPANPSNSIPDDTPVSSNSTPVTSLESRDTSAPPVVIEEIIPPDKSSGPTQGVTGTSSLGNGEWGNWQTKGQDVCSSEFSSDKSASLGSARGNIRGEVELYVGNLPREVPQERVLEELLSLLSEAGCDVLDHRSKPSCFLLKLGSVQDAIDATSRLREYKHPDVGRRLKVNVSNDFIKKWEKSSRPSDLPSDTKLEVSNLPQKSHNPGKNWDLKFEFPQLAFKFGEVLHAELERVGNDGLIGHLHMATPEAAKAVIEGLHGYYFEHCRLHVAHQVTQDDLAMGAPQQSMSVDEISTDVEVRDPLSDAAIGKRIEMQTPSHLGLDTKLTLNNLPRQWNEIDLMYEVLRLALPFGEVLYTKIVTNHNTGLSLGHGFLHMESHQAALATIKGLHNMIFDQRPLIVRLARTDVRKPNSQGTMRSQPVVTRHTACELQPILNSTATEFYPSTASANFSLGENATCQTLDKAEHDAEDDPLLRTRSHREKEKEKEEEEKEQEEVDCPPPPQLFCGFTAIGSSALWPTSEGSNSVEQERPKSESDWIADKDTDAAAQLEDSAAGNGYKEVQENGSLGHLVVFEKLLAFPKESDVEDMSASDLEDNRMAQLDEIVALHAIFGEDFSTTDALAEALESMDLSDVEQPIMLELKVQVELSHNQKVVVTRSSQSSEQAGCSKSAAAASSSSSYCETHQLLSVEHLPPLRLFCLLPAEYPAKLKPTFMIQCDWLSGHQMRELCCQLEEVWDAGDGEVIVLQWAEALKLSALLQLGDPPRIDLPSLLETSGDLSSGDSAWAKTERDGHHHHHPTQVILGPRSSDLVIRTLWSYNTAKEDEVFQTRSHTCFICFNEFLGLEFVRIPTCSHAFCKGCMGQMAGMHVEEGTLDQLRCPDTTCGEPLPPNVLRLILDEEQYARWDRLTLERTVDSMMDITHCPRCEHIVIEDSDHLGECSECFYSFCTLCLEGWHPGRECLNAEAKLRLLQARNQGKGANHLKEARKKELELINEIKNTSFIKETSKQCPSCKMAIIKSEGCNKMTCRNCGTYFCYKCGKKVDGYDHFKEGGSCFLFDLDVIQAWEQEQLRQGRGDWQRGVDVGAWQQRDPEVVRRMMGPCPNCRQLNFKDNNNNHITCWACTAQFCFVCRAKIKGTAHFSNSKCKQHSA